MCETPLIVLLGSLILKIQVLISKIERNHYKIADIDMSPIMCLRNINGSC